MKLGVKVKESIARIIAEHFTTNEIVDVFTDANIPTDKSLYAKWRIVLDAFNKTATEEGGFHVLAEFCHPLNFDDKSTRQTFIDAIRKILSYEDIDVHSTEKDVQFVVTDSTGYKSSISLKPSPETKTSTDYVIEALNFFKDEYNKVKMLFLAYEYPIGENINSDQIENGRDDYSEKLQAIKQLKDIGFITEYKIIEKVESDGLYVWDYAVCKIDEARITQKEAPPATDAGVQAVTKKIIHEHTHRFENSIQQETMKIEIEKMPDLNIKHSDESVVVKNKKRITLPRFPITEWTKVSLRFLSERDILLSDGKNTKPSDFASLGFTDERTGRPDLSWEFLLDVARKNGETDTIPKNERETLKKRKQKVVDTLRKIYKNQSDPFDDFFALKKYRALFQIVPPPEDKAMDPIYQE